VLLNIKYNNIRANIKLINVAIDEILKVKIIFLKIFLSNNIKLLSINQPFS
jgi:hypothetical protein